MSNMKRRNIKVVTLVALAAAFSLTAASLSLSTADAAETTQQISGQMPGQAPQMQGVPQNRRAWRMNGQMPGQIQQGQTSGQAPQQTQGTQQNRWQSANGQQAMNGLQAGGTQQTSDTCGEIVEGITTASASSLSADEQKATTLVMSSENSTIKIREAGTYIVTGSCPSGNITVTKGTTGVVLILRDLDLTSTTGAAVSVNKGSEVKLIVEGTVTLTDAENAADENSSDTAAAEAFDGAALKVKSGASVYLTGDGTLNIKGNTKNGIKIGSSDEGEPAFVVDGGLDINITATNDGINSGYDLALCGGSICISAGDDGIHADRVVTIDGADVTVSKSTEAIEGTVINLFGGSGSFTSSDDAINAANSDGTYASLGYSINITGGTWTVSSRGDGIDSNGNINITGGKTTIASSASGGGDAGLDYVGSLYISDDAQLDNSFGSAMDAGRGGMFNENRKNRFDSGI